MYVEHEITKVIHLLFIHPFIQSISHLRMCSFTRSSMYIFDSFKHDSSFIHPFIHSSICSFPHSFIHSFIHPSIHPYIHTSIHPYIRTSIHPYIHPFFHSSIHSFNQLIYKQFNILLIIHLFEHVFILSTNSSKDQSFTESINLE